MSGEWKPCPFCGSTMIRFNKCTLRVRCGKCFATSGLITPFRSESITDEEAARKARNTRNEKTD